MTTNSFLDWFLWKLRTFGCRCNFEKDVTIVLGEFGSGKTACAAQIALDLLFKGHVSKIYITRPIDFKATGYLTGDADQKLAFHLFPIKQNLYACYRKDKIDELLKEKKGYEE